MKQANSATITITPTLPVQLGGYRPYRGDRLAQETLQPLEANALYLKDEAGSRLLISYDLIWLSETFVQKIKSWVEQYYNLPATRVLLTAIHTHSGPQIHERTPFYGEVSQAYLSFLTKQTQSLIQQVMESTHPTSMDLQSYPTDKLPIVNRITFGFSPLKLRRSCFNAPNPERSIQDPIRIIRFHGSENGSGSPKALLISMACHPVFHKGNRFTPDYPGELRNYFRNKYGKNLPILFLQGFAGDIRPWYPDGSLRNRIRQSVLNGKFKPDFEKNIYERQDDFIQSITDTFDNDPFANTSLETGGIAECRSEQDAIWDASKEIPPLTVQRWEITDKLILVSVNAEMFNGYSTRLEEIEKRTDKTILPVGYANGMLGYLPDPDVLQLRCGYEYRSWPKFGLPGPFPADTPERFDRLLNRLFD